MPQQCGYIALLGRPNAGKSTLLNALVGDKLAVVSKKPQTTRNRILGIAQHEDAQLLFLDTPGLHRNKGQSVINTMMNRVALQVAGEADLLVYLVDIIVGFTAEDARFLSRVLTTTKAPVVIEVVWLGGEGLGADDDLTDRPRYFIGAELIREQIFRQLSQEIPYGTAVKVTAVEFKGDLVVVRATAVVSRASHKPILLGKGGARIKSIGTAARASLENHFDKKVFLELQVAVAEGWTDDQRLIADLANLSEEDLRGTANIEPEQAPLH